MGTVYCMSQLYESIVLHIIAENASALPCQMCQRAPEAVDLNDTAAQVRFFLCLEDGSGAHMPP